MGQEETFVEVIQRRAVWCPNRRAITFFVKGDIDGPREVLTYADIERRSKAIGQLLMNCKCQGRCAILLFRPGCDFITGFFGCMFGAVVGVPIYPPDASRLRQSLGRMVAIVESCQAPLILSTREMQTLCLPYLRNDPKLAALRWVFVEDATDAMAEEWVNPGITPDSIAFLQYTSGSTANPKVCCLTAPSRLNVMAV